MGQDRLEDMDKIEDMGQDRTTEKTEAHRLKENMEARKTRGRNGAR